MPDGKVREIASTHPDNPDALAGDCSEDSEERNVRESCKGDGRPRVSETQAGPLRDRKGNWGVDDTAGLENKKPISSDLGTKLISRITHDMLHVLEADDGTEDEQAIISAELSELSTGRRANSGRT